MIDKSVVELSKLIQDRQISVSELLDQYLEQIQQFNGDYHAISMISEQGLRLLAKKADRTIASGEDVGPLFGIPILVDDLLDVSNMRTSYGCAAYSDNVPEVDSIAIRRLRDAGALIMGKANTSELGMIMEETHEEFVSKSPWGMNLVSGGGASGISVALAKNFAPAAVGIDIGGNVLLPSAFSGNFALKPTHGRIPHTPIYSRGMMFPDLTSVTRSAMDCALLMSVVSGHSEVDPTSLGLEVPDYLSAVNRSIEPLSIAHAPALWNAPFDDSHQSAVADAVLALKSIGCRVERDRPPLSNSIGAWETVICANLYAEHGKLATENPDDFGEKSLEWIRRGETTTAVEYIGAQKKIFGLRVLLRTFFEKHDILIVPAAGCVAFEYGEFPSNMSADSEDATWQQYASMCAIGAISGYPTANLPVTRSAEGLPVSLLFLAKQGNEDLLLAVCAAYESLLLSTIG